jgi:DNA processing protein
MAARTAEGAAGDRGCARTGRVGRVGAASPRQAARGPERPSDLLDDEATLILESFPRRGAVGVDALAARAGVPVRTALRKLSMLGELAMVMRRDDGYALAPAPRPSRPAAPGHR